MRGLNWRIGLLLDMLRDLPDLWKVWAEFEALCMGKVEYHSCYRELVKDGSIHEE